MGSPMTYTDFSIADQEETRLNRKVELAFRGDWGQANSPEFAVG